MTKLQYFVLAVIIVFTMVYGTLFHLTGELYVRVRLTEAEGKLCQFPRVYLVPVDISDFNPMYVCAYKKQGRHEAGIQIPVSSLDDYCSSEEIMTYKDGIFHCKDEWFPSGRYSPRKR